ncbi:hypothetical protein Tco_1575113 [Tanacetum coccineum]|uniref:Uncharacterized protein n=1 Tax=Tanacetum coccineum TaxID=301880 RepID=A0ABQ5C3E6_9ASTR
MHKAQHRTWISKGTPYNFDYRYLVKVNGSLMRSAIENENINHGNRRLAIENLKHGSSAIAIKASSSSNSRNTVLSSKGSKCLDKK